MRDIFRKVERTILVVAFMLMSSAGVKAQTYEYWSGTKTFNKDTTISIDIRLNGNVVIDVASGFTVTIDGTISEEGGSRSLTKTGWGLLRLTAPDNSYSGKTENHHGEIRLRDAGNLLNTSEVSIVSGRFLFITDSTIVFTRTITGVGAISKWSKGKVILTAVNTYTGITEVGNGTLQIGDGTSGSIDSTASVVIASGTVLRFEPGADMTFSKVISGDGSVEYKGVEGQITLTLTADNTYTGTTTIEAGDLSLGYGTAAGSVAGNIINNGRWLFFRPANNLTYSGIISGTGGVSQVGTPILTLNGANTYSGATHIRGTLALGASGSIENSSRVRFIFESTKLDVSAGNKKIKDLQTDDNFPNSEVVLGSRTLTIGTSGQNDGGGTFSGKFTGTGNVTKAGTGTLVLTGESTATGTLTHNEGRLELSEWSGDYIQGANATLIANGEVTIGNTITLTGGNIFMDLTQATPSLIKVSGGFSAVGTTTLNITSNDVSNHVLMQVGLGMTTSSFALNMPGFEASLSATNERLFLTAKKIPTYTIIGEVTYNGNPLSGVSISSSNGNSSLTDSLGEYTITVDSNASVTLTPSLSGYTFTPEFITCNNVSGNLTNQNFTANGVGIVGRPQGSPVPQVYPNPVKNQLVVDYGRDGARPVPTEITIYNVVGQVVMQNVLPCKDAACHVPTVINVESLANGMYFLKIENQVIKFIKE